MLKTSFETQRTPAELGVRTCQCAFCRRHGAVNTSDPDGLTVIDAAANHVVRYRFGLQTADFVLCRDCGVYVAAVIGATPNIRSTINVAGLRLEAFLDVDAEPMQYGVETTDERIARRFTRWTPTRFSNATLNNSFFGPHEKGT
jgi:hypothetical protein